MSATTETTITRADVAELCVAWQEYAAAEAHSARLMERYLHAQTGGVCEGLHQAKRQWEEARGQSFAALQRLNGLRARLGVPAVAAWP